MQCGSNKTYTDKHDYHKWYKHQDGFVCNKCYCKQWHVKHREQALNYNKVWHLEHREQALNDSKIWHYEHREQHLKYMKVWHAENPDYNKIWRLEHFNL